MLPIIFFLSILAVDTISAALPDQELASMQCSGKTPLTKNAEECAPKSLQELQRASLQELVEELEHLNSTPDGVARKHRVCSFEFYPHSTKSSSQKRTFEDLHITQEGTPGSGIVYNAAYVVHTNSDDLQDEQASTYPLRCFSQSGQNAILAVFIKQIRFSTVVENHTFCTTLHSLPSLISPPETGGLHLHIAAQKGSFERKDSAFQNDFTIVFQRHLQKDFAFVDSVGTSLLPAGEFLVQAKQLLSEESALSVGFAIYAPSGNYKVGNILYGKNPQGIEDKVDLTDRLITRAVQAERIAQYKPCDQAFLESDDFQESFEKWRYFIKERVTIRQPLITCLEEEVFLCRSSDNIAAALPDDMREFNRIDVLIGSTQSMPNDERGRLTSGSVKIFTDLQQKRPDIHYIVAANACTTGTQSVTQPDLKDNSLLLCSSLDEESAICSTVWAKMCAEKLEIKYSKIMAIPCDYQ